MPSSAAEFRGRLGRSLRSPASRDLLEDRERRRRAAEGTQYLQLSSDFLLTFFSHDMVVKSSLFFWGF